MYWIFAKLTNSFEEWKYFKLNLYTMINEQYDIILFDGVCNLCNNVVRFIIRYDKKQKFRFVSLQSDKGRMLLKANGMKDSALNSIIFINKKGVFRKSEAALNILYDMGYPWKLLYIFILLPRIVRDGIYGVIARNRYRIFGKKNECMIIDEKTGRRVL